MRYQKPFLPKYALKLKFVDILVMEYLAADDISIDINQSRYINIHKMDSNYGTMFNNSFFIISAPGRFIPFSLARFRLFSKSLL